MGVLLLISNSIVNMIQTNAWTIKNFELFKTFRLQNVIKHKNIGSEKRYFFQNFIFWHEYWNEYTNN